MKIYSKTLEKEIEVCGYAKQINDPYERTVYVINDLSLEEVAVKEKIRIDLDGPTFIKDDRRYVVKAAAEKNGCRVVRFGEATPDTLFTDVARQNPVTMASLRAETRAIKSVLQLDGEFEVYARCELGELNPLHSDEIEEIRKQKKPEYGDVVKNLDIEAPQPDENNEDTGSTPEGGIHISEASVPDHNGIEAPVPETDADVKEAPRQETAAPETTTPEVRPANEKTAHEADGSFIIGFGKHSGKSVAELVIEEPAWVEWAISDATIAKYKDQAPFMEALPHIRACYETIKAKEKDYA